MLGFPFLLPHMPATIFGLTIRKTRSSLFSQRICEGLYASLLMSSARKSGRRGLLFGSAKQRLSPYQQVNKIEGIRTSIQYKRVELPNGWPSVKAAAISLWRHNTKGQLALSLAIRCVRKQSAELSGTLVALKMKNKPWVILWDRCQWFCEGIKLGYLHKH